MGVLRLVSLLKQRDECLVRDDGVQSLGAYMLCRTALL